MYGGYKNEVRTSMSSVPKSFLVAFPSALRLTPKPLRTHIYVFFSRGTGLDYLTPIIAILAILNPDYIVTPASFCTAPVLNW